MQCIHSQYSWADPDGGGGGGGGGGGAGGPGKSQVTIGFLKILEGTPPGEAIGPLGFNCFLRKVLTALCFIH